MPTPMSSTFEFPAPPDRVFALMTDRAFLEGRLTQTGGQDPEVVSVDTADGVTTLVTREAIPASVLPSMVSAMINGDPVTERTERWRAEGDGYAADFGVVVKGAPASMKGTMTIAPAPGGSTLTVAGTATVPVPLFGGKIESIVVERVQTLLEREAQYTARSLQA
ncbi:DUF2505 domain-containing protein [Nakamurella endophytica]|uniref:DUF2505 domain-containing protein n=1 Tax=Nakamurella endophytica TaxID=1748367 RepID=A0A917T9G3_9ACTN|nr:DUF2505 domain-containing protein [Nakamurella endophytica]GGM15314.1 hypothetical protein GCM10011594_39150 [Nakamurella endophytica]